MDVARLKHPVVRLLGHATARDTACGSSSASRRRTSSATSGAWVTSMSGMPPRYCRVMAAIAFYTLIMTWRALRLTALAAAIPALAIVPGSSSVALPDAPSISETGGTVVVDGVVMPGDGPRALDRRQLGTLTPVGPGPISDCYPIGKVRPTEPGPVTLPRAPPRLPGPVPIPEVQNNCASEQRPGPIGRDQETAAEPLEQARRLPPSGSRRNTGAVARNTTSPAPRSPAGRWRSSAPSTRSTAG